MENPLFLGIDIGGSKTAWGYFNQEGHLSDSQITPTPTAKEEFLRFIEDIIGNREVAAIGIGIAGTISADHEDTVVCPNLPSLSHLQLVDHLHEKTNVPVALDNDARCALIGEVWQGGVGELSSCIMLTLGTGVGGAVMQKGKVLAHPTDINQELSHLVVDPTDMFPASSGRGTLEALLGGRNLETRLGVNLAETSAKARQNNTEALAVWKQISHYFITSIQTIYLTYHCGQIIIAGKGVKDLDLYLQDEPPCPIVKAVLGESAGLYGAARIGIDLYEQKMAEVAEWGEKEVAGA